MSFDYKATFENAKKACQELAKRRAEIDAEMAVLKQTMDIVAPYIRAEVPTAPPDWGATLNLQTLMSIGTTSLDPSEIGMTQAIRTVLREAQAQGHHELSPTEVRDRLAASKFDLSKYDNALAAIHTILKRVATEIETADGKKYRLIAKSLKSYRRKMHGSAKQ